MISVRLVIANFTCRWPHKLHLNGAWVIVQLGRLKWVVGGKWRGSAVLQHGSVTCFIYFCSVFQSKPPAPFVDTDYFFKLKSGCHFGYR